MIDKVIRDGVFVNSFVACNSMFVYDGASAGPAPSWSMDFSRACPRCGAVAWHAAPPRVPYAYRCAYCASPMPGTW